MGTVTSGQYNGGVILALLLREIMINSNNKERHCSDTKVKRSEDRLMKYLYVVTERQF